MWTRSSLLWHFTQRRFLVTDVSEQAIGSIFVCHAVCLNCLTVENGIDRLFRTVGNYIQSTLHKIPEDRISLCCCSCIYRGVANKMKRLNWFDVGIGKETFVMLLKLLSRLLSLDLEILRNIGEQIASTVAEIRTVYLVTLEYLMLVWRKTSRCAHKRNIILNNVRQHNYLITQGNYIGYVFRLLMNHLQAHFVNWVTRCYAHIGIPSCFTMGSQCVHSILWLNWQNEPEDDWSIVETCSLCNYLV